MKTSIHPSRNTAGELVPAVETSRAGRQPSSKAIASSIPTPTFTNLDNITAQKKSSLPQRSSSIKAKREASEKTRRQDEGIRPQQPGSVRRQIQQDSAPTPGHQSLAQPQDLLPGKGLPHGIQTEQNVTIPASPLKKTVFDSKQAAPSSPLKSQMPPPPRPTRSASVRQPSTPKLVTPGDTKGHVRHRSHVLSVTANQAAKQTGGPSSLSKARPQRPQFSTYQQHFSPKKEPKPLALTVISPRPAEPDARSIAASRPDVAALQTELLQLCLLRSSFSERETEWRINSGKQLRKQYDSIAGNYRGLLAEEREAQRLLNIRGLHHWFANAERKSGGSDLGAQIQTLSRVIQEVMDLSDPQGSRYTEAVKTFDDWLKRVGQVRNSRKRSEIDPLDNLPNEPEFINPLDLAWKEEINALDAKVELCLRELQNLDITAENPEDADAALIRVANGHKDLLISMIEELKAMRKMEIDIVRSERSWTTQTTEKLLRTVGESSIRGPRAGAWKRA
jgi:hypothetical protein